MLSIPDRNRMLRIIGRHNRGLLTAADEAEMRAWIGTEYPEDARKLPFDHAYQLAMGMCAVHFFFPEESGLKASG